MIKMLAALALLLGNAGHARAGNDWAMYNGDASGSRENKSEVVINRVSARGLHVAWETPTRAMVSGTPLQHGSAIYVGDYSGRFFALDAATGAVRWTFDAVGPISATAAVVGNVVTFGDLAGFVYGLDRRDGTLLWQNRYNSEKYSAVWGSPTPISNDLVALGLATDEEKHSADPDHECCTRGSVVLYHAADGTVEWHTYMGPPGTSGASVWSTPTYDAKLGLLFVSTGNNYSPDTGTDTSDAILALRVADGGIAWRNQRYADDGWSFGYPDGGPDWDFGDSPQVYRLPGGRKVVGAGQKSGFYHVLDAATGEAIGPPVQYAPSGILGGLFADSAYAGGVVFANTASWDFDWEVGFPIPLDGSLVAFTGDGQTELWRFPTEMSPNNSGVAVAGGVVLFVSTLGGLYALDTETGELLSATFMRQSPFEPRPEFSVSGPSVANGRVCAGTGSLFDPPDMPMGSVVCLVP